MNGRDIGMARTGRRQTVRRWRTPEVWEDIPTGAKVTVGDELVFAWLPPDWTAPMLVRGLVVSAGVERRSWFVAVDSTSGRQGTWYVRLRRGQLAGTPHEPCDPQWWLANPPCDTAGVRVERARTDSVEGQMSLFDEDAS
jgi:hypothetical protein